jgi:hypothetical protein
VGARSRGRSARFARKDVPAGLAPIAISPDRAALLTQDLHGAARRLSTAPGGSAFAGARPRIACAATTRNIKGRQPERQPHGLWRGNNVGFTNYVNFSGGLRAPSSALALFAVPSPSSPRSSTISPASRSPTSSPPRPASARTRERARLLTSTGPLWLPGVHRHHDFVLLYWDCIREPTAPTASGQTLAS